MKKLPPPNWATIKTRYVVHGEKPSDIAKDFKVCANTISKRASLENWGAERKETSIVLHNSSIDTQKHYQDLCKQVHLNGMTAIAKWMQDRMEQNPDSACLEFDGEERLNSAYLEILKASKEAIKGEQSINITNALAMQVQVSFVAPEKKAD